MTTHTDDLATLPAPGDIELRVLDRQARERRAYAEVHISFPDFCTICLDLHEGELARNDFLRWVNAKCDRVEARGETIEYPLRMTRWAWFVEWNAFDARDATQTEMGARYAGAPR